jgi:N-acetylmuramoyl-L-alanine amidase
MVPLAPGENLMRVEARPPFGDPILVERRFTVNTVAPELPKSPVTLVKESITPADDLLLQPGDTLRVSFQGSPQGTAEFSIEGLEKKVPMVELGNPPRGLYEGSYIVPRDATAKRAIIAVSLKGKSLKKENARGRLTIDSAAIPRVGLITEDTVAARTAADGGYDVFLYRGMKVQLTAKIGGQWRVRFSAMQSGWVKESAIQELPRGTSVPQSMLTNMKTVHGRESTLVHIPLSETLPYRVEQSLDPMAVTLTLFGATNKTDLIRYDPLDPLIRIVRWRQIAPDICQVIIEPRFSQWWGFDVRYEGTTLLVEIREPWRADNLKDMIIAVDPGHGGSDRGAVGPHGTLEKDANLAIAKVLVQTLKKSGAKPFLTRTIDSEVSLYERPRIAWQQKARLFISVHCNSAGLWENPIWNNGSSVYFYQPQSQALAQAVHAGYRKHVPMLPDRGLYYADFAVCRMIQMPAILTEQAYMIVPQQEQYLFDPTFHQNFANAIVNGIKSFLKP